MISFRPFLQLMEERRKSIYHLKRDKIVSTATLDSIRRGDKAVTTDSINAICAYLGVQPGDIMEYIPDDQKNQ
jgi:DNA-binding Xre family transcriptional regulator